MARTFDKYIFREVVLFFAMSLCVFTFVLLLGKTLSLAELVILRGVEPGQVLKLILFLIPSFLVITIPMALLAGVSMAFSRLSSDNEILVMKASGLGPRRLMVPVAIFSLLSLAAALSISLYVAPASNYYLRGSLFRMVSSKASAGMKEKAFINFFDGLVLYANEVLSAGGHIRGVLISDMRVPERPQTIAAQEGVVLGDKREMEVFIRLRNGSIHTSVNETDKYNLITFQQYDLQLDLKESLAEGAKAAKQGKEMSLGELNSEMTRRRGENRNYRQLLMEYHKRFSIPASTLFLGLIGAMIGMLNKRSGRLGGFSIALAVILAYYLLFIAGESLSNEGKIAAFWAAWSPNFFVAITALAALSCDSGRMGNFIAGRPLLRGLRKLLWLK